jgi:hypothetical protein
MAMLNISAVIHKTIGDQRFVIASVSDGDGNPVAQLDQGNFEIDHQGNGTLVGSQSLPIAGVDEGPSGVYRVEVESFIGSWSLFHRLVFSVRVRSGGDSGLTIACQCYDWPRSIDERSAER